YHFEKGYSATAASSSGHLKPSRDRSAVLLWAGRRSPEEQSQNQTPDDDGRPDHPRLSSVHGSSQEVRQGTPLDSRDHPGKGRAPGHCPGGTGDGQGRAETAFQWKEPGGSRPGLTTAEKRATALGRPPGGQPAPAERGGSGIMHGNGQPGSD